MRNNSAQIYRAIYAVFFALSLGLLVSGVLLVFFYRPTAAQAWDDIYELQSPGFGWQVVPPFHRWCSWALTYWAVLLIVVEAVRRRGRVVAALIGALAVGLMASFTGYLLPWDQLALWAVTVGRDIRGFGILFDDDVRYVLVDGVEVSRETLQRWFFGHIGLGAAAVTLGAWLTRRAFRTTLAPPLPAPEDVAEAATSQVD